MQCHNCKHEVSRSDKFCPYCGSPIVPQDYDGSAAAHSRKGRNRRIVLFSVLAVVIVAAGALLWLFWPFGSSRDGIVLSADENYLLAGQTQDILFTAETEEEIKMPSIMLCDDDGNTVGELLDNGAGRDAAPGDGIYSCSISLSFEEAGSAAFHAEVSGKTSNTVSLYTFAPLTEETASAAQAAYDKLNSEIYKIEGTYTDGSGSVPADRRDALISEIESLLDKYRNTGDILLYETEGDSIYIKFTSGLAMVYEPSQENVSADGTDTDLTLWVYQPNPDIEDSSIADYTELVADSLANCDYIENYTGTGVTLDLVKTLPNNSVVLWNGHGGYGPIVKSFLATGEYFDWSAWFFDIGYYADCVTDRIICRSTDQQDDLACVTSKFITEYCGDLSNSVFFLSSCHSAQHDRLANAFLSKGAEAVLGFTDTVYTGYCQTVCCNTLGRMASVNEETGNYYTLSEALNEVTAEAGADDLVWASSRGFSKPERAEPAVIGNANYRLAALRTLEISLLDKDDGTPISGAVVTADNGSGNQYSAEETEGDNGQTVYRLKLPGGEYTITATCGGYIPGTETVEVTGDTFTDMRLQSGGTVTVYVTDAETGEIISGAYVECSSLDDTEYTSEGEGTVTLHLPYGRHEISVSADGYSESVAYEVAVSQEKPDAELNVELTPVQTLAGTYVGQYEATQGETGLTLTILSDSRCIFSFYNLPGHDNAESGSYYADIRYEGDEIIITGFEWVDKPLTYSFVEFRGTLSDDGTRFTGSVDNSSWEFDLTAE